MVPLVLASLEQRQPLTVRYSERASVDPDLRAGHAEPPTSCVDCGRHPAARWASADPSYRHPARSFKQSDTSRKMVATSPRSKQRVEYTPCKVKAPPSSTRENRSCTPRPPRHRCAGNSRSTSPLEARGGVCVLRLRTKRPWVCSR